MPKVRRLAAKNTTSSGLLVMTAKTWPMISTIVLIAVITGAQVAGSPDEAHAITKANSGIQRSGSTVYIGAESSDFRVRVYDKALEQGIDDHWVRVELVMRHENANAFVAQLTNSETVGKLAAQVINDKLAFIDRDDSNITRCTVCDWWIKFVDELEAVRLVAREVVQHSVDRISEWVSAQVGPSLAILLRTMGENFVFNIGFRAGGRLSDKQLALIDDFNALKPARA